MPGELKPWKLRFNQPGVQPGYWIAKHSSLDSNVQERLRISTLNHECMHAKSLQSCLTLCDPVDCSPPGSSGHGDSPDEYPGMNCHALLRGFFLTEPVSLKCPELADRFFTTSATWEAHLKLKLQKYQLGARVIVVLHF